MDSLSYRHITSGVIFLDKHTEYVDIPVQIDNSASITIHMHYSEDAEDKSSRFTYNAKDNVVDFHIYNVGSSLGAGTIEAAKLGSAGKEEIYMHMWCYRLSSKDNPVWKVEYAIYLNDKEEKNG